MARMAQHPLGHRDPLGHRVRERRPRTARPRPKLDLTREEHQALRATRIRLGDLADMSAGALNDATGLPFERCAALVALSQFQRFSSVGPSVAKDLWSLGYRSPEQLRTASPGSMYQRFCALVGSSVDPCVEDGFRCGVAQSRHPDLPGEARNWWYWTEFRGTDRTDP